MVEFHSVRELPLVGDFVAEMCRDGHRATAEVASGGREEGLSLPPFHKCVCGMPAALCSRQEELKKTHTQISCPLAASTPVGDMKRINKAQKKKKTHIRCQGVLCCVALGEKKSGKGNGECQSGAGF